MPIGTINTKEWIAANKKSIKKGIKKRFKMAKCLT